MTDYRFDYRTESQFKKDIKTSHDKEAKIAVRLCISCHAKTKIWPTLKPAGIDASGEFIENAREVTAEPDFRIGDRLVEITRSDVFCNRTFHQKSYKIVRALKNGSDLVFVNGYDVVKQPNYIWLTSKELEPFVARSLSKYGEVVHPGGGGKRWTNKPAYRFDVFWFQDLWKPLPCICRNLPQEYYAIINLPKV